MSQVRGSAAGASAASSCGVILTSPSAASRNARRMRRGLRTDHSARTRAVTPLPPESPTSSHMISSPAHDRCHVSRWRMPLDRMVDNVLAGVQVMCG